MWPLYRATGQGPHSHLEGQLGLVVAGGVLERAAPRLQWRERRSEVRSTALVAREHFCAFWIYIFGVATDSDIRLLRTLRRFRLIDHPLVALRDH